mmetsp:Transcript_23544/g.72431  ORF Transcript_23544/g.72431 Transcript_23544/m.72431 type:complete len:213 (-) Transcript_23544:694-1332(-)
MASNSPIARRMCVSSSCGGGSTTSVLRNARLPPEVESSKSSSKSSSGRPRGGRRLCRGSSAAAWIVVGPSSTSWSVKSRTLRLARSAAVRRRRFARSAIWWAAEAVSVEPGAERTTTSASTIKAPPEVRARKDESSAPPRSGSWLTAVRSLATTEGSTASTSSSSARFEMSKPDRPTITATSKPAAGSHAGCANLANAMPTKLATELSASER